MTWFMEPSQDSAPHQEFTGFMDLSALDLPADAEYYLCGPLAFMQMVRSSLIMRGIPAQDIRYEVFGPDLWLAEFESADSLPAAS